MMSAKNIIGSLVFLLIMLFVVGCGDSNMDAPVGDSYVVEEPLISDEVNSTDEIKKGPPYKDIDDMFADSWWIIEEANSSVESPREPVYVHFANQASLNTYEKENEARSFVFISERAAIYSKIDGELVRHINFYTIEYDSDTNKSITMDIGEGLYFAVNDANLSSDNNIFHSIDHQSGHYCYVLRKHKDLILRRVKDVPFEPKKLPFINIVNEDNLEYTENKWIVESGELDTFNLTNTTNMRYLTLFSNVNYNVKSTYRKYREYDIEHTNLGNGNRLSAYTPEIQEAPYNLRSTTQMQMLQTYVTYDKYEKDKYLKGTYMILKGTVLNPDSNESEDVAVVLSGKWGENLQDSINKLLTFQAKPIESKDGDIIKKEVDEIAYGGTITILPLADYEQFVSNIDVEKPIEKAKLFDKKLFSSKMYTNLEVAPRDDGNSDLYFLVYNIKVEKGETYPIAFSFSTDLESFEKMVLVNKTGKIE